ncbi:PEP-CTERM sorting domain-containing protein [Sphingobium sp.]|uniref:PEP-CTERM sorting domain-containing protein n=1 Tax=Sphingobium sp. TaxID=1912891 RepID=UPI0026226021|nr:PEP-CTERM sorting domain-containing protein [Sphingobium sp.]
MKISKILLATATAGLMGAAVPAPAQATWWCWFGKCGTSSSSSGGTTSSSGGSTGGTSSSGGSSGGTPTPVPEPEQMALFGMGAAVLVGRLVIAKRKRK